MSRHGRVLVAMSGGVDSSVTAALLHEEGYDVVGVTMKTWDYETSLAGSGVSRKASGCCSLDDMNDAREVAVRLGVPHLVVDIRDEFGGWVIDRFEADYLGGRTPNPCVLCNTHIKWAALLRRADALDCDWIATGHYARVRADGERWVVSRGLDRGKDQSYALWGVAQEHLARSRFPLGAYTKPQIRQLAAEMGFAGVADKPDSYEICFVPDDDYRGFLARRQPELFERVAGGPYVHSETGETIGTHEGYPFYTVGQRRGLGLATGEPIYVVRIEPDTNTVVVGTARGAPRPHAPRRRRGVGCGRQPRRRDPRHGLDPLPRRRHRRARHANWRGRLRAGVRRAARGDRARPGRRALRRRRRARRRLDRSPARSDAGRRRVHGPSNAVIPVDPEPIECPACGLEAPADAEECPFCGYEFPVRKATTRLSAWLFVGLMLLFAVPFLAWLLGWLS